jgi:hypothetical protein
MSRYYAVALVAVVKAEDAEAARDAVTPREENLLSEDDAYLGVVYAGEACPITVDMARDPDWHALIFYSGTEAEATEGRALPLMPGDDAPGPTTCDRCGDVSNSAPGLRCGRVDDDDEQPCAGTYR